VRIVSTHLARQFANSEQIASFIERFEGAIAPYIKGRGVNWELHIEEHAREMWRENGLVPPLPKTEGEKLWVKLNKSVPY
jgi:hypothetical protein